MLRLRNTGCADPFNLIALVFHMIYEIICSENIKHVNEA